MTYVTPADYAARHGLRESLVRRMARDGRLPRLATREVLIPEDAIPDTERAPRTLRVREMRWRASQWLTVWLPDLPHLPRR